MAEAIGSILKSKCRKQCQERIDRFHQRAGMCPVPFSSCKNDAFEKMRPEKNAMLDYNISQTDVKLDVGDTALHLQKTEAEYTHTGQEPPPPPPPPKSGPKIKYCTGGGPVWEFLDEKLRRQYDELQQFFQDRLIAIKKRRKAEAREQNRRGHIALLKLAGPDWYQELSPNQLKTIDQLKNCIMMDLRNKTIINTQDNIAALGLVLRPYHKHIETALQNCCACPVEFLLVLYQLIDPERTEYSINDRLLLSSVVHLTMRETLRELHVRIPSPPPNRKEKEHRAAKVRKQKYLSPYLEPYTFKPAPRKYTGIYEDKHRQYPESPYFSYIDDLKLELQEKISDDSCSKSVEYGNVEYESERSIVTPKNSNRVPVSCQRASRESQGAESQNSASTDEDELKKERRAAQKKYNSLTNLKHPPKLRVPSIYVPCNKEMGKSDSDDNADNKNDTSLSIQVKVTTEYDEFTNQYRNKCECTVVYNKGAPKKEEDNEEVCAEQTVTKVKDESSESSEDSSDEDGAITVEESIVEIPEEVELIQEISDEAITEVVEQPKQEEPEVQEEAEEPRQSIVRASEIKLPAINKDGAISIKERVPSECVCKAEVQKIIDTTVCQCDKCLEDKRMAKRPLLIISSTKMTEDEELLPVIGGVKPTGTCKCLSRYQENVRKYEMLKVRKQLVEEKTSLEQKYVIGGVAIGKDGKPIYTIQSTVPKKPCPCVQMRLEQQKEQERLANMPQPIEGDLKCVIGGVKETPQGNVFVVSGVVPKPDCRCMKVYNAYDGKHKMCDTLYKKYVEKVKRDLEEYLSEVEEDLPKDEEKEDGGEDEEGEEEEGEKKAVKEETSEEKEEMVVKDKQGESVISISCDDGCLICDHHPKPTALTRQSCKIHSCPYRNAPSDDDISSDEGGYVEVETNLTITLERTKNDEDRHDPSLASSSSSGQCHCADKPEETEEFHRFIILPKIPCGRKKQIDILKRALETLAEDGFPLAKLPEAYKLPHFKLWMQLRCGTYWTLKDKYHYLKEYSKEHWNHTSLCQRKVDTKIVDLGFSHHQGNQFTWLDAAQVRKMVSEKVDEFYRKVRQAAINDGREFFPSTFTYEFPFSSFRDCFFAYTPAKEEEVHSIRPWYSHEYRTVKPYCSCR